ncbi:MAG TPA: glycine betaine ABC transporter substrate-binding protein [Thermomicrobiales bacterium]|jgi:osmoprotectant transport system substrate-binding protein|nr:glycine betaine ABC transporter substrate-binding protein [Thermomicrobiales bacterium]
MFNRRSFVKSTAAAPLLAAGIAATTRAAAAQDGETVVVGSKDFTEQFILGNMYLQVLENAGIPTDESLNLGGTQVAHQALVSGDITLYPEYTGTGLTEVLQIPVDEVAGEADAASPVAEASPAAGGDLSQVVFDRVKSEYESQFELTWLERSPANNTQALAVKREFSEENGITSISQLAEVAGDYIISAPADFPEREDGLLGLQRVYGAGFESIEVLPVAPGLKYQALLDDEAQVVLAFGTDGQISGYDLVILEDDLGLWPPYNIAPVIQMSALEAYPEIPDLLNPLTALLTDEVLSGLNWRVDGDEKAEPADVAQEFLQENGLLG